MSVSGLPARRARLSWAAGAVACALVVSGGAMAPVMAATRPHMPAAATRTAEPGKVTRPGHAGRVRGQSRTAPAAVTAISTVYKTGSDPATGSTASSPGTPGHPAGSPGTTHPGDTISWAVSYQNATGAGAGVNVKDPLTAAGAYVPGSLQLPPNPDPVQAYGPQYSTDGGASWSSGTPPAGASGVGLTGTLPTGTQQQSPAFPAPTPVSFTAGSGYNAVTSPGATLLYAVSHLNNTNNGVYCTTQSAGVCPGWPANTTYVSPAAGTPIGTGANGMATPVENGTFIADGNLYWEAQSTTPAGGLYPAGVMCLNLTTLHSCGFTQLATAPLSNAGFIGGSGTPASDGNYYFLDAAGKSLCFTPAAPGGSPCGTTGLVSAGSAGVTESVTYGNYVLGQVQPTLGGPFDLVCYDVSTGTACPGFPVSSGPSTVSAPPGVIAPVLGSSGNLTGACVVSSTAAAGCWNLSGSAVANPYPAGTGQAVGTPGDVYYIGTKVYLPIGGGGVVACKDFVSVVGGTVRPCTGFTNFGNIQNFTVRPVTGIPGCLVADGNPGHIGFFSATSGGACLSVTSQSETVSPAADYCASGAGGFTGWGQLALTGLNSSSYGSAVVTLLDAGGAPVPGFTGVTLPAGTTTLDISSLSASAYPSITAQVSLMGVTSPAGVTGGQVALSWAGDPVQVCFQTTAPPVPCGQSAAVTNNATAVTAGTGGSDAPGGNSSGDATFTSTPRPGACSLDIAKTAAPAETSPGGTVTYTVTVRNAGTADYAAPDPAQFSDDLTNVLGDAAYNGDASASTGSVSYAAPVLSWSGDLAAGASATITYSVTVRTPDAGPHKLVNAVTSTSAGSNCAPGSPGPACTATVPVADVSMVKTATPGTVHAAGEVISYSFAVTNTGQVPLDPVTVTDIQAPPAGPLTSGPTCPPGPLAPGETRTCTATYTVTQADVDNGSVDDSATASGTPPSGPPVTSPPSPWSVPAPPGPAVTIVKSAPSALVAAAGDVVGYEFLVTNTGNVTLHNVTVADVQAPPARALDGPVTCSVTTLAPGASVTCTATYTMTVADFDNGQVEDTATATGTPPSGPAVTSPPSVAAVPAPAGPQINIVKSATPALAAAAGAVVTYRFTVTNAGNVTLRDVAVSDDQAVPAGPLDGPVTCPVTVLAPGASVTCTGRYTVTQADIDHGTVSDSATATATPPSGPAVTSPPVGVGVLAEQSPGITVDKKAPAAPVTHAGQQLRYSFTVTNTGNVTLHKVTVTDVVRPPSDPANLSPVSCPQGTLAPGESETCTATYAVTQADVDHGGPVDDSATVTGIVPATAGNPSPPPLPPSPPSDGSVRVVQAPGLRVVKTASPAQVRVAGGLIWYRLTVTNTGNVTLHDVTVSDPVLAKAGITVRCPQSRLAPGASQVCTPSGPYVVTGADAARGTVTNAATGSAVTPSGRVIRSRPSTVRVRVTAVIVIPTGEGAGAAAPGASPGLAAVGTAALAAGTALLLLAAAGRRRRRSA